MGKGKKRAAARPEDCCVWTLPSFPIPGPALEASSPLTRGLPLMERLLKRQLQAIPGAKRAVATEEVVTQAIERVTTDAATVGVICQRRKEAHAACRTASVWSHRCGVGGDGGVGGRGLNSR